MAEQMCVLLEQKRLKVVVTVPGVGAERLGRPLTESQIRDYFV
jgi:hypothetical protein